MSIADINLDDRRFQDLVNEARIRIAQSCPEWTEHNVSDPGITLIELFAWMTEMTIYRLNRVPEKLQLTLLELLDIHVASPSAARTDLQFKFASAITKPTVIPGSTTEVSTLRTANDEVIVFEVDDDFTIMPIKPVAYMIQRSGKFTDATITDGVARPRGTDQIAFSTPPVVGDALLLGFQEPISRLMLDIEVDASQARGAGIDPDDPPLRWEVSQRDGSWAQATLLSDTTGGFNYGAGHIQLQLPDNSGPQNIHSKTMTWLRCRVDSQTVSGNAGGAYSQPPEIYTITVVPIGASVSATHANRIFEEYLGVSDGTPSQSFKLDHQPVLDLEAGDTLEVQDPHSGDWAPWELVEDFVASGSEDRHFTIDPLTGSIQLGPSIRQPNASWRQYGLVPPKGSNLRFSSYRHGGGASGNVAPGHLTVMKTAIPGVDAVTNPNPALGGVDAESLDQARQRAALEIRSRYRAVTADDYAFLAEEASSQVARAICVPPTNDGPIIVRILPMVQPPDKQLSVEELTPTTELLEKVGEFLDERRLLGANLSVLPMRLRGVSVVVEAQVEQFADADRVHEDIEEELYTFLNPLVGGQPGSLGGGWGFGRSLTPGELFGVVGAIDGVELVRMIRVYETDMTTGERSSQPIDSLLTIEHDEVIVSGTHLVKAQYSQA